MRAESATTPTSSDPGARPLAGQHALVTGGGRGIGAAVAERLARLGADLTLVGRTDRSLQAQQKRCVAHGVRVATAVADVTDETAVAEAFAAARRALSEPTVLINNAGSGESAPFARTDLAFWRRMLDVNLTSAFLCARAAVPAMLEAGSGRIINIASTAGLVGYRYVAAYVAAKHGVVGLTRALALELARTGITVNAVCPGFTETDMIAGAVRNIVDKTGRSEDEARAQLAAVNPQGRLVRPEEVANAVAWLALPESAAMTGQAIAVAGGEVM